MAKQHVTLTFPEELIREPVIYNFGHQFNIVTNILQADVTEDSGWIVLELDGDEKEIQAGITWAISKGVRVESISIDRTEI